MRHAVVGLRTADAAVLCATNQFRVSCLVAGGTRSASARIGAVGGAR